MLLNDRTPLTTPPHLLRLDHLLFVQSDLHLWMIISEKKPEPSLPTICLNRMFQSQKLSFSMRPPSLLMNNRCKSCCWIVRSLTWSNLRRRIGRSVHHDYGTRNYFRHPCWREWLYSLPLWVQNFSYPFAGTFLDRKIGFRSRESNPGPFKAERLR